MMMMPLLMMMMMVAEQSFTGFVPAGLKRCNGRKKLISVRLEREIYFLHIDYFNSHSSALAIIMQKS